MTTSWTSSDWHAIAATPSLLQHGAHALIPERRGMASSFQASAGSFANALVAGLIVPLVMHSTVGLATTSLLMMAVGLIEWTWVKPRLTPTAA